MLETVGCPKYRGNMEGKSRKRVRENVTLVEGAEQRSVRTPPKESEVIKSQSSSNLLPWPVCEKSIDRTPLEMVVWSDAPQPFLNSSIVADERRTSSTTIARSGPGPTKSRGRKTLHRLRGSERTREHLATPDPQANSTAWTALQGVRNLRE